MRYRLRTLLIVLAVGPVVLAVVLFVLYDLLVPVMFWPSRPPPNPQTASPLP
jgi:hypothetical protein